MDNRSIQYGLEVMDNLRTQNRFPKPRGAIDPEELGTTRWKVWRGPVQKPGPL